MTSQNPTPFDAYEISGCREFLKGTPKAYVEQVADADAQFFSLYGHIPGEGVECIGDYKTRAAAEAVQARIEAPLIQALRVIEELLATAELNQDDLENQTGETIEEATAFLRDTRKD